MPTAKPSNQCTPREGCACRITTRRHFDLTGICRCRCEMMPHNRIPMLVLDSAASRCNVLPRLWVIGLWRSTPSSRCSPCSPCGLHFHQLTEEVGNGQGGGNNAQVIFVIYSTYLHSVTEEFNDTLLRRLSIKKIDKTLFIELLIIELARALLLKPIFTTTPAILNVDLLIFGWLIFRAEPEYHSNLYRVPYVLPTKSSDRDGWPISICEV